MSDSDSEGEMDDMSGVSSDDSDSEDDIPIAQLPRIKRKNHKCKVGDIVEVWWTGECKWFEGEVIGVKKNGWFRVHYKFDGQKHWHDTTTRVRLGR